jgi:hypothetical protein
MKLVGIIEEYEVFSFSNFKKIGIFCESYGVLKTMVYN